MIWSISESKTFRRCQRQWYFKNIVASAMAKKDPIRRRAYLLSKLQSIFAWRGQLVDTAIEKCLIPALNSKRRVTLTDMRAEARRLFGLQLEFARAHRLHEPGMSVKKAGDAFAAFHCIEYGGSVSDDDIERAWNDIDRALATLFELDELAAALKSATYVIAQRALIFSHSDESVRAVPDVIAFYDNRPPRIIDWKVHTFGQQEAWLQLGTYAVALTRCKPHRDFPQPMNWAATDIGLEEVQLLTGVVRPHRVTDESLQDIESYIADSVNQIRLSMQGQEKLALVPEDFPTTQNPDVCSRCPYQALCWEDAS
jgi:hypothetical protein